MVDYWNRLNNLRTRRQGDTLRTATASFAEAVGQGVYGVPTTREAYEVRGKTNTIRYALGAMQAVDPAYTQALYQEGERVQNQLTKGLNRAGITVEHQHQGSVPLDIHIERHSDIDLLVLHGGIKAFAPNGPVAQGGGYSRTSRTSLDYLVELRTASERVLKTAYPAAAVDISGNKSIAITGGSFRYKVDVVPSLWHDTVAYQQTYQLHDRGVFVLIKSSNFLLPNSPFLHIKRINDKEALTAGGTKKVVRFLKTLRADSDRKIALTSYDIASLVWHFNTQALIRQPYQEIALIAVAQAELDAMCCNYARTSSLRTPDDSRLIIDDPAKFGELQKLLAEVNAVATDIAVEFDTLAHWYSDRIRPALESAIIG